MFNLWLWWWAEQRSRPVHAHALLFLTGYLVEWSLSMDNVFVFVVIFAFFGVPLKYQYRVLFWGIIGAIVMRLTFISWSRRSCSKHFDWMFYVFGAFLIYTGIKLATSHGSETHPGAEHMCCGWRGSTCALRRGRMATSFLCGWTASCS